LRCSANLISCDGVFWAFLANPFVNITAWSAKNMHRKILPHGEWTVDMGKRKTWHGWHLALINTDYGLCWIGVPYIGL